MNSELSPLTQEEVAKIKGETSSQKLIKTKDDKTAYDKLNDIEKKLLTRMINNRKTKASVRSLSNYIKIVRRVYNILGKKFTGGNIYSILTTGEEKIIDTLNNKYKNSKDVLWAIVNVLKAFPNTESSIKKYSDAMGKQLKRDKFQRGENKKNEKQSLNWKNYDKVMSDYKNKKGKLNLQDRTLISFVLFFPRRLADWYRMRLHKRGKKKDKDNDNYLNLNERGVPVSFEFNRQKTADNENRIKYIPSSLKNMITSYIRTKELKNGDLLFPNSSGNMYTAPDFSNKISSIFLQLTDRKITNNMWRHIYITKFGDSRKFNVNQKKNLASNMGQSFNTQQEYIKK